MILYGAPLDDHVRRWKIATRKTYLHHFTCNGIVKRSAYRWERLQYMKAHPLIPVKEERLLSVEEIERRNARDAVRINPPSHKATED